MIDYNPCGIQTAAFGPVVDDSVSESFTKTILARFSVVSCLSRVCGLLVRRFLSRDYGRIESPLWLQEILYCLYYLY
jgi:hypothetical protein